MEPPSPSSRFLNLKKSFNLGIRSLLTALSKEDVHNAFPAFTVAERESLYRTFVQAIKSLHENIEEEFEAICLETKAGIILAMVEQLVEEQSLDILYMDKPNIGKIKEMMSMAKKEEIQYLTSLLEKVEEQNNVMRNRVEILKQKQGSSVAVDAAVDKLRSFNSNYYTSFSSS